MTGTMTWAAMDVHARSTYAASLDVITGELCRQRFDTGRGGAGRRVVGWGCRGRCVRATRRARPGSGSTGRRSAAGDRVSGDRAIEDAASASGDRDKSDRRDTDHAVAPVDGRRADAGRGPVRDVRGGPRSGQGARAGQARSDALPAHGSRSCCCVTAACGTARRGLKTHRRVALGSQSLRASQHGAGVHRQPRRVRRADVLARTGARRAALAGRDRTRSSGRSCRRLRAFRGIDTLSALILVLEVADFDAVPSRGAARIVAGAGALARAVRRDPTVHGSITKTGSKYARRILVRGAPGITPARRGSDGRSTERQEGLPDHVLQIARAAPRPRLYRIHKRMREHKKPGNVITVACARELSWLPRGRRDCPITQTDRLSPLGGEAPGPKSAGTREATMDSPHQATPALS